VKDGKIVLMPGDRIMVPTGLIFDIPEGYSLRIHPRSGLSYKQGLVLANLEAVIDSDYVHETFVLLTNLSENPQTIYNGDRVAQAELVSQLKYEIEETTVMPTQKTDRVGGLGSTGVGVINAEDITPEKRGRGRPRKEV
jgi:dUTP pyrophosphatase